MASEDDDRPRTKISHEIGQDLSLLSVEELGERIALWDQCVNVISSERYIQVAKDCLKVGHRSTPLK